jgi:conjugal transfer pilus assembly protein TraL
MSTMNRYYIFQHLDDPTLIAIWTLDEFLALVGPMFFGLVIRHAGLGAILSAVLWWSLKKIKAGRSLAYVYGLIYWHLSGTVAPLKGTPPAYARILVG